MLGMRTLATAAFLVPALATSLPAQAAKMNTGLPVLHSA